MAFVSRISTYIHFTFACFALGVPFVADAKATQPQETESNELLPTETVQRGRSAIILAALGGFHTATGDTESAPPPHGYVAVNVGFEAFFNREDPSWAWAPMVAFGASTADPGKGLAFFFARFRLAHYVWLSDSSAVVPWLSVGIGAAGYDVTAFGGGGQLGLDYLFTRYLGAGVFGDVTAVAPAEDTIGLNDDFDGAVTYNFGGRLFLRIAI